MTMYYSKRDVDRMQAQRELNDISSGRAMFIRHEDGTLEYFKPEPMSDSQVRAAYMGKK